MGFLNLPNILTTLRIILIPLFLSFLLYGMYLHAMVVFAVAALTDFLDGAIARAKGQETELGKFLDPIADKFLLVSSFVVFAINGFVPKWLSIVIISRDVIIVTGWLVLFFITHHAKVEPSLPGKLANACQLILLTYILFYINFDHGWLPSPEPFEYFTAGITVFSGLHYIYRELR
ncbi:MAG: CDP-alcohol phosphatidyltransferase family protein [Nitrospirae bacterium]|nr:MAG: CDP-alcohol phosphatidyltransferase family protein [Nitrospirota bacterium]